MVCKAIAGAAALMMVTSEVAAYGEAPQNLRMMGGAEAAGQASQTGEPAAPKSSHANMEPTLIASPAAWFGPQNYPPQALRANRQGRVVAAIKVDARGVAVSCSIEVSSGTTSLDEATCNNALAHAAFDPATDSSGKRIEGIYHLAVRWVLPERPVTAVDVSKTDPEDTLVEYEIKIDAEGRAISCTPTAVRMITELSPPCAQFSPGAQTPFRWKRKGKFVGARLIYHTTLHVAADQ